MLGEVNYNSFGMLLVAAAMLGRIARMAASQGMMERYKADKARQEEELLAEVTARTGSLERAF